MLIIIYVGAIAILFLFVIMLLDLVHSRFTSNFLNLIPILAMGSALILLQLAGLFTYSALSPVNPSKGWELETKAHLFVLGYTLYTEYVMFFLLVTLILGIAMLGAVLLTLGKSNLSKTQNAYTQQHRKPKCK